MLRKNKKINQYTRGSNFILFSNYRYFPKNDETKTQHPPNAFIHLNQ